MHKPVLVYTKIIWVISKVNNTITYRKKKRIRHSKNCFVWFVKTGNTKFYPCFIIATIFIISEIAISNIDIGTIKRNIHKNKY